MRTQGEGCLRVGSAGRLQGCTRQNAVWNSYPCDEWRRPLGSAPRQPARAAHSTAQRGAARLWLVLDMRRRMGEGRASGGPWGGRPREGRLGKAGGEQDRAFVVEVRYTVYFHLAYNLECLSLDE